jgi:hypothetical protein
MSKFQVMNDLPEAIYFSFPCIDTYVNAQGEMKKKMSPYQWQDISKSKIVKGHKAYAFKTGAISGLSVLDIDSKDVYQQIISTFPYLKSYYTVETNKGFHIYFKYDERLNNSTNVMDAYTGIDIRNDGGIIYAPPTTYILPDGKICKYILIGGTLNEFPQDLFHLLNYKGLKHSEPVKKTTKKVKMVKDAVDNADTTVETKDDSNTVVQRKYSAKALHSLIELIDKSRAVDYDTWISIGLTIHQCNSTKEGLEVFQRFSQKCPEKYNATDCAYRFNNNFNKCYQNLTIGTLKYYARLDNKTAYEMLDQSLFDEPDHFTCTEINQQYILSGESTELVKSMIDQWMNNEKILAIKSAYNTGKTQTLHFILKTYSPKKVLFITYRQTLSYNFYGNFKEFNVGNYLAGDYKHDKLICQVESLHKLTHLNYFTGCYEVPEYDLIVFDESESILAHTDSPTIKHKLSAFTVMVGLLKKAKHIIALDGDFANRSYDFLKSINNEHSDTDFPVLQNHYVPSRKHWHFTDDEDSFFNKLDSDLQQGKKVYVSSMSSEMALRCVNKYQSEYKTLLHSSKTDDTLKEELQNVNEFWIRYDLVACSPSIEAGVDFNVEHFDKMYVILSSGSTSQRGLMQMTNRVRQLRDLNVEVLLNKLPFHSKANFYCFDEVSAMFDNHINNAPLTIDQDGNLRSSNAVFDIVNKYNQMESLNKNNAYFVPYLLKLLAQKQQPYSYVAHQGKADDKKTESLYKQLLCNTPNISSAECLNLLKLQKKNMATMEDKLSIERFMYKSNWGLLKLDDETMSKIYRKTHILFNNKAINNEPCKNYESIDDNYQDVSLKIKLQKLKLTNELLQVLTFKNDTNEFTNKMIDKTEWDTILEKARVKAILFTDKTALPLFDLTKNAIQKLTTNKAVLGFLNRIFKNYGIQIKTIQKGKNKTSNYFIHQLDLFQQDSLESEEI